MLVTAWNFDMNLLKNKFEAILTKNPNYSTYIAFANALLQVKIMPKIIVAGFDKFVNKKDYSRSDKEEILNYLLNI